MRIVTLILAGSVALAAAQAASAQTRVKPSDPTPPPPTLNLKKKGPDAATPDLVVIKAVRGPDFPGGEGRIFVQVKNIGNVGSAKNSSLATHNNNVGCGTYFMVPALAPGAVSSHTLKYCKDVDTGTRVRIIADEFKKIDESNENNNIRYLTW